MVSKSPGQHAGCYDAMAGHRSHYLTPANEPRYHASATHDELDLDLVNAEFLCPIDSASPSTTSNEESYFSIHSLETTYDFGHEQTDLEEFLAGCMKVPSSESTLQEPTLTSINGTNTSQTLRPSLSNSSPEPGPIQDDTWAPARHVTGVKRHDFHCPATIKCTHGGLIECTNESGKAEPQTSKKGGKRTVTSAFAEEPSTDSGRTKQLKTAHGFITTESDTRRQQFACPFQKLYPQVHQDCLKYSLHRIKDVKQHVYRRHMQPNYYCPRCSMIFKTDAERDEHVRHMDCIKLPVHHFDGISTDQRRQLNKNSSRGLDHQDQWFELWDIVFPNQERPTSAYVGSYTEEMVPLLRKLWNNRENEILNSVLQDQDAGCLSRTHLSGIVKTLLDRLEAETAKYLSGYTPRANAEVTATNRDTLALPLQSIKSLDMELDFDVGSEASF